MATQEISAFSNFSGTNEQGYVIVGGSNGVEGGKKILSDIVPVVPEQVQADWEQDDDTQKDYIKNKPDIPQIDEETIIINDENKLAVAKPIPDSIGYAHNVLTVETNDGDLSWHEPTVYKAGKGLNYASDGSDITFNVDVPVPDPNDVEAPATDGYVLTYDADADEIVWDAPQGGGLPPYDQSKAGKVLAVNQAGDGVEWTNAGGGGNPYTKTTLAAPDATTNGHQTSYGTDFYDQSITINNNSYTIVSNVAYGMVYNSYEETYNHEVVSVENFTINLAQTDFPLAVVEFILDEKAAVVNIHVNNGNTPLTRMYSTPYLNTLLPNEVDDDTGKAKLSFDTGTIQQGSNYYYINGIYSYQLSQNKPSLVTKEYEEVYTKVVIKIFGDTFTVLTNNYNADIPAS